MRNIVEGKHSRLEFDSIGDLRKTASEYRNFGVIPHMLAEDKKWFGGVRDFDEILKLARIGWDSQLEDTLSVVGDTLESVEREYDMPTWHGFYDVSGADVDVARYLSGEPENMISYLMVETPKAGRVITLVMNVGAGAGVSAQILIARGKAVVALVCAIESIGLRTELKAELQVIGANGFTTHTVVTVKEAGEDLDPALVMFAYAHPAFFRGLMIVSQGAHPERFHKPMKMNSSNGEPVRKAWKGELPEEAIRVQPEIGTSAAEAKEFVVKHLKSLGII